MAKKQAPLSRRDKKPGIRAIKNAALELIQSLTDDHEECRVCGPELEDEGKGGVDGAHHPDRPCGRLLGLIQR